MLNDFQEDLRKLYVKVRRSEVEDCFIKIASIEGQLLSVFLSKGHKNLPLQSSALELNTYIVSHHQDPKKGQRLMLIKRKTL